MNLVYGGVWNSPPDVVDVHQHILALLWVYEEVLATFRDEIGRPNSILAAMERLCGYLTDGEITRLAWPDPLADQVARVVRR